jgi:carnitine O-acetyltransferase
VNYFYAHKDDKTRKTGPSRAAGLTRALLFFRRLLVTFVLLLLHFPIPRSY